MRIDIVTVLPELLRSPFEASIMKRAIDKGLVEVHFHNLRDYTTNRQKVLTITLMVVVLEW
jgi:tRNA (guanine37-N1)-methyltransferase